RLSPARKLTEATLVTEPTVYSATSIKDFEINPLEQTTMAMFITPPQSDYQQIRHAKNNKQLKQY
ncbi:hypothetical protein, partial [Pluralibacter sp.]|uniref:hypothetical protein n=1 Tax=Pluralibacter sp. TaxID=1920032 RepID=UPI0025FDCC7C